MPSSINEILTITNNSSLVRSLCNDFGKRAWRSQDASAVAFLGRDAELRTPLLGVLGLAQAAADLALEIKQETTTKVRFAVQRPTYKLLAMPLERIVEWSFRATYAPPAVQRAEDQLEWLQFSQFDDIAKLLQLSMPDSSAWPGDDKVRRWAGILDHNKGLVACVADTTAMPGVGHISAIAVHPDTRRQGFGAAVTAWITRRLLAEGADVVTLAVLADNHPAQRMYDQLGFTINVSMTSGNYTPMTEPGINSLALSSC